MDTLCLWIVRRTAPEAPSRLWLSPSHQFLRMPTPSHSSLSNTSLGTPVHCQKTTHQDSEAEEKDQVPGLPVPIHSDGGNYPYSLCWAYLHLGQGEPFSQASTAEKFPQRPGRGLHLEQENSLPQVLWKLRGARREPEDNLTPLHTTAGPVTRCGGARQSRVPVGCSCGPLSNGFGSLGEEPS